MNQMYNQELKERFIKEREETVVLRGGYLNRWFKAIAEFEEIRKSVEKHNIEYEKNMIKTTITIGLVFYKDGETLDSLIKEVDSQLYIGKENGRNRISYCL